MTDRFVVGTGRCGSTLLTKMLDTHRDVIGLNEVFTGLDWGRRFTTDLVDGPWVADVLGTPNHVIDMVMGKGYDAEEVTYPFRPTDRYQRGEPIPWILTSTLGHLTDDPDALWDEVSTWMAARPLAPIAQHYRALFSELGRRRAAFCWVERSGSSVDYLDGLLSVFDQPKIVHLVRDGAEVALSMREHPFYRLAVQLVYGIMPPGIDPDDEDAVVDGWLTAHPPVELYGRYWSDQLEHGAEALESLGPDRLLTLRFEAVVADPVPAMEQLIDFLELPADPGCAERAAALVRGVPPRRTSELSSSELGGLLLACDRGQAVLSRFI